MMQVRLCLECGDKFYDFDDRRMYATLCKGCEAVEIFKLFDEGVRKIIRRGLDDRGIEIHSGFTQRVDYVVLATVSRVLRSITKSLLEAYMESRRNGVTLWGLWKFSVELTEAKTAIIATVD